MHISATQHESGTNESQPACGVHMVVCGVRLEAQY